MIKPIYKILDNGVSEETAEAVPKRNTLAILIDNDDAHEFFSQCCLHV